MMAEEAKLLEGERARQTLQRRMEEAKELEKKRKVCGFP